MKRTVVSCAFFFVISQSAFSQQENNENNKFDIAFGLDIGRRNEVEIVGFPYAESETNIRPELGITHERTGAFVNFGATKTSSPHDAVGDQVSVSIGWAGETPRWRIQTDLNRYDVDVTLTTVRRGRVVTLEGRERMHSLRFLLESKRECGAPYVWLQEFGGTTAHIVGVGCATKWASFAAELGGNDGISRLPAESLAFSRLKIESTAFKWLGGAKVGIVSQFARAVPFEDETWGTLSWDWSWDAF